MTMAVIVDTSVARIVVRKIVLAATPISATTVAGMINCTLEVLMFSVSGSISIKTWKAGDRRKGL